MSGVSHLSGPDEDVRQALNALAGHLEKVRAFIADNRAGLFTAVAVMAHPSTIATQQASHHASQVMKQAQPFVTYEGAAYELAVLGDLLQANMPLTAEGVERFRTACLTVANAVQRSDK